MNKNKKEYLNPSVVTVLLETQSHMLTSTIKTYDATSGTEPSDEEEITRSDEIL